MSALCKFLFFLILLLGSAGLQAQRTYAPASVLAEGSWQKISVSKPGVYRITASFLSAIGFSLPVPSSQLRLYGNGGSMLSESNAAPRIDDLKEVAIWVEDGGDGQVSGNDYVLFYAPGPNHWAVDSQSRRFRHQKNLYAEKAFYFLSVGGNGLRIGSQAPQPEAPAYLTSFDERYFHELDTINFLNSGKEWYGEELSSLPGRQLNRSFTLPLSDLVAGSAQLHYSVAARSVNTASQFVLAVNGQSVANAVMPAVSAQRYDLFAQEQTGAASLNLQASTAQVQFNYVPGSVNSQGWINWFEFFARRRLNIPPGEQLLFRDWSSIDKPLTGYQLGGATSSTQVWDVSDPSRPLRMHTNFSSSDIRMVQPSPGLREYVAFSNSFLNPVAEGAVPRQNLHGIRATDYLIVTHPSFTPQAERLASFHRGRGVEVVVAKTSEIFNEFASGTPDPTAIRDFVKMVFDLQRNNWQPTKKFLLLLGKGSFDYKNRVGNNTNLVPAYQSRVALDPLNTYTSDDFFGFLEDHEDINASVVNNTLDLAIGRIPATALQQATNAVDKILHYHSSAAMGPWRLETNFVADDEDQNLHLQDAEILTGTVKLVDSLFTRQKIYLDAFRQESGFAGGRYPEVNLRINNQINNGTLTWNYSGHGGPDRLAEEVILDQGMVNTWQNQDRLPLFITATCDFAPYDNPYTYSLGEDLLLRQATGAIGLMTTSRVVFAYSNRIMNDHYLRYLFSRDSAGARPTLGAAGLQAKNFVYRQFGDIINNRKFSLIGDPAITLAFPRHQVRITKISSPAGDTLSAASLVQVTGEVRDSGGSHMSGFTGKLHLTLYDRPVPVTTLANDAGSFAQTYLDETRVLFRGQASVESGGFSMDFRLPKDLGYQPGHGRISLYASSENVDAAGVHTRVVLGGQTSIKVNDRTGPEIKAWLNDEKFVDGGISNAAPVLLVNLFDSSGINASGLGIGHDLVATLDGDNRKFFVLNNYYEAALDDYRRGTVRFQLPKLEDGPHSLRIKAWDIMNNSSETILHFTVVGSEDLRIDRVLSYPNPFTTNTQFWFEHNQPLTDLQVQVDVYTVGGRRIKSIRQTIKTPGNRSSEIDWNGTDDYGQKIGRGVYIYRLRVVNPQGQSAEKWERLVLLQ